MSNNINSTDWSSNYIDITKSPLTKFYRNFLIKKLKLFEIINDKNSSIEKLEIDTIETADYIEETIFNQKQEIIC